MRNAQVKWMLQLHDLVQLLLHAGQRDYSIGEPAHNKINARNNQRRSQHYMCNKPMHSLVLRRSSNRTSASTAQPTKETVASDGAVAAWAKVDAGAADDLLEAPTAAGSSNNLKPVQDSLSLAAHTNTSQQLQTC